MVIEFRLDDSAAKVSAIEGVDGFVCRSRRRKLHEDLDDNFRILLLALALLEGGGRNGDNVMERMNISIKVENE